MWFNKLFRRPPPGPEKGLFVFAIRLIGRYLTDDFDSICRLLGKTLQSCLEQVDPNFRIFIACNEIPKGDFLPQDDRIEYIVLEPVAKSVLAEWPWHDGWVKRQALMKAATDIGARYFFCLDADDLVSNLLVGRVRNAGDLNGYVLGQGYLLDSRTNHLYLLPTPSLPQPSFDELCGSSIIVSLDPENGEEIRIRNMEFLTKVWHRGHDSARRQLQAEGRPAHVLGFPAAIYRANHGRNYYMQLHRDERSKFIDEFVTMREPIGGSLLRAVRKEFSFFE